MANRFVKGYKCTICGKFYREDEVSLTCPHCGEVVAADDSYSALSLVFLRNRLAVLATT